MAVEQSGSGGGSTSINKYYVPLGPGTTTEEEVAAQTWTPAKSWTWKPQQRYTPPATTRRTSPAPAPAPVTAKDRVSPPAKGGSSLYEPQIKERMAQVEADAPVPHGSVWRSAETVSATPWYNSTRGDTAKPSQSYAEPINYVQRGWEAATSFLFGSKEDGGFTQPTGGPDPWSQDESFRAVTNAQDTIEHASRASSIFSPPVDEESGIEPMPQPQNLTDVYREGAKRMLTGDSWSAIVRVLYSGGDLGQRYRDEDINRIVEIRDDDANQRQDQYVERIKSEGMSTYQTIPGAVAQSVVDYVSTAKGRSVAGLGKNVVGTYLARLSGNFDAVSGAVMNADQTGMSEQIVRATNSIVNRATSGLQYSIQNAALTEFKDSDLSVPGWASAGYDIYGELLRLGADDNLTPDERRAKLSDFASANISDHRAAWNMEAEQGIRAAWEATQRAGITGSYEDFKDVYVKSMTVGGLEAQANDGQLLARVGITAGAPAAEDIYEEFFAAPTVGAAFALSAQDKIDQAAMMEPGPEKDALLAEGHHEAAISEQAVNTSPWQIYLDKVSTAKAMIIETIADPNMMLDFWLDSYMVAGDAASVARAASMVDEAIQSGANPKIYREALAESKRLVGEGEDVLEATAQAAQKANKRAAQLAQSDSVVEVARIDNQIADKIDNIELARGAGVSERVIVRMESDATKLRARQVALEATSDYKLWAATDTAARVKTEALRVASAADDYATSRAANPAKFWRVTESGMADISTEDSYDLAIRLFSGVSKPQDARKITLMYLENPESLLVPLDNMLDPAMNGRIMGRGIDFEAYEPVRKAIIQTGAELPDVLSRYSIKTANGGGKFNPSIMPSLFGDATMKGDTIASGIIENADLPIGVSKVEFDEKAKVFNFMDANDEVLHSIKGRESELAMHKQAAEHMRLNREKNYVRTFNNKVKHWLTTTALITRPGTWINNALNANFYSMVDRTFTMASEKTVDEWWRMMTGELDYSYRLQGDGIDGFREAIGMEAKQNSLLADTLDSVGARKPAEAVRKAKGATVGPDSAFGQVVGKGSDLYSGQSRVAGSIPFGEAANYANQLYGKTKSLVDKWIDRSGSAQFERWLIGVMGEDADRSVIKNMVKVYKSGARRGVAGMTEEMAAYLKVGARATLPEDFPDDVAAFMNYISPDGFRRALATGDINVVTDYTTETIKKYEVMTATGPMEHGSAANIDDVIADLSSDLINEAKMVASGSGVDTAVAGAEAAEVSRRIANAAARIADIRASGEAGIGIAVQGLDELESAIDSFRRARDVIAQNINPQTVDEFAEYGAQVRAAVAGLEKGINDLASSLSARSVHGGTTAPVDTIVRSGDITDAKVADVLKGASAEESRIIRAYHERQSEVWNRWKPGLAKGDEKDVAWDGYKAEMRQVVDDLNAEIDAVWAQVADGSDSLRAEPFTYAVGDSPPGEILAGLMTQPFGPNDSSYAKTMETYKGYVGWHRAKMVEVAEQYPSKHVQQIYIASQGDIRRAEMIANGHIEDLQQAYRSGEIDTFAEYAARRNEVYLDAADAKGTLYADAKEEIITAVAYEEMIAITQEPKTWIFDGVEIKLAPGAPAGADPMADYQAYLRRTEEVREKAVREIRSMRILHESPLFTGTTDVTQIRRMASEMLGIDTSRGDASLLHAVRHDKYASPVMADVVGAIGDDGVDEATIQFREWFDARLAGGDGAGLDVMDDPALRSYVGRWVEEHAWDDLRTRRINRPDASQLERQVRDAERALYTAEGQLTEVRGTVAKLKEWEDIKVEDIEDIIGLSDLDDRIVREQAEMLHKRWEQQYFDNMPDPLERERMVEELEGLRAKESDFSAYVPEPGSQEVIASGPNTNMYLTDAERADEAFMARLDELWKPDDPVRDGRDAPPDLSKTYEQGLADRDQEARNAVGQTRAEFRPDSPTDMMPGRIGDPASAPDASYWMADDEFADPAFTARVDELVDEYTEAAAGGLETDALTDQFGAAEAREGIIRAAIGQARFEKLPPAVDFSLSPAEKLTPRSPRVPIENADQLEAKVVGYLKDEIDDPVEWLNDTVEQSFDPEVAGRYFAGEATVDDLTSIDEWVRDEVGQLKAAVAENNAEARRTQLEFDIAMYDMEAEPYDSLDNYRTVGSFEAEVRTKMESDRHQGMYTRTNDRASQLSGQRKEKVLEQLNEETDWDAIEEMYSGMPPRKGKAVHSANEITYYADHYLGLNIDQILPFIQEALPNKPKFKNRMMVHEYGETDRRLIYRKLQERAVEVWEGRVAEASGRAVDEVEMLRVMMESAEADAVAVRNSAREAALRAEELLAEENVRPRFTTPEHTQTIDQASYDFIENGISSRELRRQIDGVSPAMPDQHAIEEARKVVPDLPRVSSIEDLTEPQRRAMSTGLAKLSAVQDELVEVRRYYDNIMEGAARDQANIPPGSYGNHVEMDNFAGKPSVERRAAREATASMASATDPSMQDIASYNAKMSDRVIDYAESVMGTDKSMPVDAMRAGQIMNWITHEGTDSFKAALLKSTEIGKASAAFTMLDYSKRRYIDEAMGMFAPYTYFMTRNAWNSLRRSAMHPHTTAMIYRANQKWDENADVRGRIQIGSVGDYQIDIPNLLNVIAPYWPLSHWQAFLPNRNASNGVDEAANVTAALGIQSYNYIDGIMRMLTADRTNVTPLADFRPQESIPPITAGFRAGMVALGNSKLRDSMVRNEPDYRLVATGRYLADAVSSGKLTAEDAAMAMEYGTSVYYKVDGVFGDYDPAEAAETFTDASQAYYGDLLTNQLISHMFLPIGLRRENIEDMRQERLDNTGQYDPDGNTGATSENRDNYLGENPDIRAYSLANKLYVDPAAPPSAPEPYDESANWFDRDWGFDPRSPGESYYRAMKYQERDAANEAMFLESQAAVLEGRAAGLSNDEINDKLYDVRDKYFGEYGVEDSIGIIDKIDAKYKFLPETNAEYNPFPFLHPSEAGLEVLSQTMAAARAEYKDDKATWPGDDAKWSEQQAYYDKRDAYNENVSAYVEDVMNDFGKVVTLAHGYPLDATETQRIIDVMINAGTPAAKALDPATMETVVNEAGLIYRGYNQPDSEEGKLWRTITDGEVTNEERPPADDLGYVPESSLKYGAAQPRSTEQALDTGDIHADTDDIKKLMMEIDNMDEPKVVQEVRRAILAAEEDGGNGGGGGGGGGGGRRGGGGGGGGGYGGGGWADNGLSKVQLSRYPSGGISGHLMPDPRNRRGIRRSDSSFMWNLINGFKYVDKPKFKKL